MSREIQAAFCQNRACESSADSSLILPSRESTVQTGISDLDFCLAQHTLQVAKAIGFQINDFSVIENCYASPRVTFAARISCETVPSISFAVIALPSKRLMEDVFGNSLDSDEWQPAIPRSRTDYAEDRLFH